MSKANPAGRRHLLAVLLVGGALLVGGLGLAYWHTPPSHPAMPPTFDFTHMDPAVGRAVADAREQVIKFPRSADAWGKLGMILLGHQLSPEAADCFARAEQLAG